MPVIIDMDMPGSCFDCKFFMAGGFCLINRTYILAGTWMNKERSLNCPLKECK